MDQQQIIQAIKQQKVLPLFYHDDADICLVIMKALYDGGIRCIEFTNRGSNALANFTKLVNYRNSNLSDLLLATGTIKTAGDANSFINAGADFLISPVYDETVAAVARTHNKLWIPGCMTPTEIHVAQTAGCSIVKLFPGNVLGTGFVEGIKPLFTGIEYLVTGGVEATKQNINSWLNAGVAGVGLGSKLITKELLTNKNFEELAAKTKELLKLLEE